MHWNIYKSHRDKYTAYLHLFLYNYLLLLLLFINSINKEKRQQDWAINEIIIILIINNTLREKENSNKGIEFYWVDSIFNIFFIRLNSNTRNKTKLKIKNNVLYNNVFYINLCMILKILYII